MGGQVLAIDDEFVLLGLAPEDRVIVEYKTGFAFAGQALEDDRGRQATDASAHDYAVVGLAGVIHVRR